MRHPWVRCMRFIFHCSAFIWKSCETFHPIFTPNQYSFWAFLPLRSPTSSCNAEESELLAVYCILASWTLELFKGGPCTNVSMVRSCINKIRFFLLTEKCYLLKTKKVRHRICKLFLNLFREYIVLFSIIKTDDYCPRYDVKYFNQNNKKEIFKDSYSLILQVIP